MTPTLTARRHSKGRALTLVLCVLVIALAPWVFASKLDKRPDDPDSVIAVGILLLPDAALDTQARTLNATLRQADANGFALDDTHVAHVTLLHGFIERKNLHALTQAVQKTVVELRAAPLPLATTGYEQTEFAGKTMTSIGVAPHPTLRDMQLRLLDAIKPFRVGRGTVTAFHRGPADEQINEATLSYVTTFSSRQTGDSFKPHLTIGVTDPARPPSLPPHQPLAAAADSIVIVQLGNYGTARKVLWKTPLG